MSDKQRAEFEKWASQHEYDLTWSDAIDCYAIMRTRVVFDAWQAAIASVVVELPELEGVDGECENFNNGFYAGYQDCMDDIKKSIELAGIRYE